MTVTVAAHRKRPWYREPMVWLLIAIPSAAVVMGAVIITLSVRHQDGLVVDDYYKRGLEINRSLERDRNAALHGLGGDLDLLAGQGAVALRMTAGKDFEFPHRLRLELFHGTRQGLDTSVELRRLDGGNYTGRLPRLAAGRWTLQLQHGDWRLLSELQWPRQQRARLAPQATP